MKWLFILIVMVFTAYPVIELSRCVIEYMIIKDMGTQPEDMYYWELAFIWMGYLAVPLILNWSFNLIAKMAVDESKNIQRRQVDQDVRQPDTGRKPGQRYKVLPQEKGNNRIS